jgi:replicative DNA helicase
MAKSKRHKDIKLSSFQLKEQLRQLEATLSPTGDAVWPYRGVDLKSFPLLTDGLDSLHNSLYVLAGATRMGKTAFTLQIVADILLNVKEARVIYISLEQSARDLNIRLVGMCGEVKLEYLTDPTREGTEKYDDKKMKGLELASSLADRFTIVDESCGGLSVASVVSLVEEARVDYDGPLFIVVDPLVKLRSGVDLSSGIELHLSTLSRELKTLAMEQNVGIFVTTGVQGAAGSTRPSMVDMEKQSALLYDAQAVLLIYCDYFNNPETPFLEWEWGTDDLMVPIFEVNVVKNKMTSFSGRLYYRFYNSFSKFKECVQIECDNYEKMLFNIRVHDDDDPIVNDMIIGHVENLDRDR